MYATSTRSTKSTDGKAFLQAIWAALILAAIVAGGAVIAQPSQGSSAVPAAGELDASALRNPPAVDDRQLDGSAVRNPASGFAGPGNDSAVGITHR